MFIEGDVGRGRSWVGKGRGSEHTELQLPLEHVARNAWKRVRNTDLEVSKCDWARERGLSPWHGKG